jgi:ubiquinol-cytochrome c reductase cytochrome c subunit
MAAVGLGFVLGIPSAAGAAGAAAASGTSTPSAQSALSAAGEPGAHTAYHSTTLPISLGSTLRTLINDARACRAEAAKVSHPGPPNTGSPVGSSRVTCVNGRIASYGDSAITYKALPSSYISVGESLFEQNCSSCHLADAQGGPAAPSLIGVGPATVTLWVSTGLMPAATPLTTQAEPKPPRLTHHQAQEIAAFITSLSPAAPFIPSVNVKAANLAEGASLFALNCAACHTITGAGDELAYGTNALSLHTQSPTQVAEAIRTGPGNMPVFSGNLSDSQVRDIVAYVTEKIQHPTDPGGAGLGGIGPVAEGFVALLFGVGGFMLVCYWIGDRA